VEDFIRTRLAVSAGCCRDACRFSLLLCGCEAGVVTLAMRLIGDPLIFNVLLQVGRCGGRARALAHLELPRFARAACVCRAVGPRRTLP
jgi:hypothetical protein